MDSRSRTLLRSVLIGYLALLAAAIVTGNPVVQTAADLGFAGVVGFFGYLVYRNRSPSDDERIVLGTAAAFVLAGVAQLLGLVPGLGAAAVVSTGLFVLGFLGYFLLRR